MRDGLLKSKVNKVPSQQRIEKATYMLIDRRFSIISKIYRNILVRRQILLLTWAWLIQTI